MNTDRGHLDWEPAEVQMDKYGLDGAMPSGRALGQEVQHFRTEPLGRLQIALVAKTRQDGECRKGYASLELSRHAQR